MFVSTGTRKTVLNGGLSPAP